MRNLQRARLSILLHGDSCILQSFQSQYSWQPYVGSSHGNSAIKVFIKRTLTHCQSMQRILIWSTLHMTGSLQRAWKDSNWNTKEAFYVIQGRRAENKMRVELRIWQNHKWSKKQYLLQAMRPELFHMTRHQLAQLHMVSWQESGEEIENWFVLLSTIY